MLLLIIKLRLSTFIVVVIIRDESNKLMESANEITSAIAINSASVRSQNPFPASNDESILFTSLLVKYAYPEYECVNCKLKIKP